MVLDLLRGCSDPGFGLSYRWGDYYVRFLEVDRLFELLFTLIYELVILLKVQLFFLLLIIYFLQRQDILKRLHMLFGLFLSGNSAHNLFLPKFRQFI